MACMMSVVKHIRPFPLDKNMGLADLLVPKMQSDIESENGREWRGRRCGLGEREIKEQKSSRLSCAGLKLVSFCAIVPWGPSLRCRRAS